MKFNFFHSKKRKQAAISSATTSWHERISEDTYTGWSIILVLSALTALILVGYAGDLLYQIRTGAIDAPVGTATPVHASFDSAALNSLSSQFAARETASTVIVSGTAVPPDPSR